jgi:hypothetical protein
MKILKSAMIALILACESSSGFAHEMRHLGGAQGNGEGANVFMFHIGFSSEPAFKTVVNGMDISVSFHPDEAHNSALTQPVDTATGGVVRIEEAEVLFLDAPSQSAQVIDQTLLPVPTDNQGNIRKKWGTDNKYIVYFRPTTEGAYGFRLKGHVEHAGHTLDFNETFICGAGTQDVDPVTGAAKSKFNCVESAVPFPSMKTMKQP